MFVFVCVSVCVSVHVCVCVCLLCLLLLQGLDGAKGDKVSLPFCLDEGNWRGFNIKRVEQMVITRDGSTPHYHTSLAQSPVSHTHTRIHTHMYVHAPASGHI